MSGSQRDHFEWQRGESSNCALAAEDSHSFKVREYILCRGKSDFTHSTYRATSQQNAGRGWGRRPLRCLLATVGATLSTIGPLETQPAGQYKYDNDLDDGIKPNRQDPEADRGAQCHRVGTQVFRPIRILNDKHWAWGWNWILQSPTVRSVNNQHFRRLNDRTATIAAATRLKNRRLKSPPAYVWCSLHICSIRQRLGVRARLSLPNRSGRYQVNLFLSWLSTFKLLLDMLHFLLL